MVCTSFPEPATRIVVVPVAPPRFESVVFPPLGLIPSRRIGVPPRALIHVMSKTALFGSVGDETSVTATFVLNAVMLLRTVWMAVRNEVGFGSQVTVPVVPLLPPYFKVNVPLAELSPPGALNAIRCTWLILPVLATGFVEN